MKSLFISIALLATALAAHAQSWTNRFGWILAQAMTVDAGGNVLVAGLVTVPTSTQVTVKFSNAGIPLWTNSYKRLADEDLWTAGVAVDTNGNVFVSCSTMSALPGSNVGDFVTLKYSSAGQPLWTNRYDSGFVDLAVSLAVDSGGNVIVTGTSQFYWTTIKLSSAGSLLWARQVTGPNQNEVNALAVDGNNNIFVTGSIEHSPYTIKYSPAGAILWANNIGWSVAVDANGNAFESDANVTVKYSSAGVPLWTNLFGGKLVVDSNGDVIVRGVEWTTWPDYDSATIKYSNSGAPLWTNRYKIGTSYWRPLFSVVGADRSVVIASIVDTNWVTIKYSADGLALWTNLYSGYVDGQMQGLGVDGHGHTIVVGNDFNSLDGWFCAMIKYASEVNLPKLDIQRLGSSIILSWTNAAFGLQSAPTISGTFTNILGATSPHTNTITGGGRFFRLAE